MKYSIEFHTNLIFPIIYLHLKILVKFYDIKLSNIFN